jgi:hypothetical protein
LQPQQPSQAGVGAVQLQMPPKHLQPVPPSVGLKL